MLEKHSEVELAFGWAFQTWEVKMQSQGKIVS